MQSGARIAVFHAPNRAHRGVHPLGQVLLRHAASGRDAAAPRNDSASCAIDVPAVPGAFLVRDVFSPTESGRLLALASTLGYERDEPLDAAARSRRRRGVVASTPRSGRADVLADAAARSLRRRGAVAGNRDPTRRATSPQTH